jgi:MOSC domain-containing protein YiiM
MAFSSNSELSRLLAQFPRSGRVDWIGLRPARDIAMQVVSSATAETGVGLVGDRYCGASGKRGISLIQAEHLPVIAALAGRTDVDPSMLRRNLLVSGIPLIALKGRRFRIGDVLCEGTGPCDPCSRMETALGQGGYNAMRGHGGLIARVLEGGEIHIGDEVYALSLDELETDLTSPHKQAGNPTRQ